MVRSVMYVRDTLEYNVMLYYDMANNELEFLATCISVNNHCSRYNKHTVCLLYWPPGSSPSVLRELKSPNKYKTRKQ